MVRGDRPEGLGREQGPELGGNEAAFTELLDDPRVVDRVGNGRDAGRVPPGCPEERRAADVDHLDCLVDRDQPPSDLRGERLDVDDDDVDRADAVLFELLELLGHVAAGEDAGIDRGVERLDLPADERRNLGQLRDRRDLDPVGGEVVAGTVGRVDLDVEVTQGSRERRYAVAIRDRKQGSHPGVLPSLGSASGAPVRVGSGLGLRGLVGAVRCRGV